MIEPEEIRLVHELRDEGYTPTEIAERLERSRSWVRRRLDKVSYPDVEFAKIPAKDPPVNELLDQLEENFDREWDHWNAKQWFEIKIQDNSPMCIVWFGDPHLDSPGCNWRQFRRDVSLCAGRAGVYGINLGDLHDNWVGRLLALYGDSNVSRTRTKKLIKWFLQEAGINWLGWILGNHDAWNHGMDMLEAINVDKIPFDEQIRTKLVFPNGEECRMHIQHKFSGNSIWNAAHALMRAAKTGEEAHIFAEGDRHNAVLHQEELAGRGYYSTLIRARGYKWIDDYAERLGHRPQQFGAAVATVIDPVAAGTPEFVTAFNSVQRGIEFMEYLRNAK